MTDDDAASMIATMDDAGLMLATGFCYRYSAVAQNIKRLVSEGAIGEVRALRLVYIWNLHGRDRVTSAGEIITNPYFHGRMIEGGPMVDCGVHQIDLARWWLGSEVAEYQALGAWGGKLRSPRPCVAAHGPREPGAHDGGNELHLRPHGAGPTGRIFRTI